jgi:hypothetical protein
VSKSDRRYYESIRDTPAYKARNASRRKAYRALHPEYNAEYAVRVKIEVLSHYGPEGELCCSWPQCEVTDVDMLSLDHVNNDGAQDRKNRKNFSGEHLYHRLRKAGYPEGFQTLCHNHQWKKQILLLRENRTARRFL